MMGDDKESQHDQRQQHYAWVGTGHDEWSEDLRVDDGIIGMVQKTQGDWWMWEATSLSNDFNDPSSRGTMIDFGFAKTSIGAKNALLLRLGLIQRSEEDLGPQ
ncbi:MAG: hypothetical protein ACYCOR_10725 [Acidobacteriaceae bacterium]